MTTRSVVVPSAPALDRETEVLREIDAEANAALAAIPAHLRTKRRATPTGSTRLTFSHRAARPATPDTRKA